MTAYARRCVRGEGGGHGGRAKLHLVAGGVAIRVAQRIPAMTEAIWHNRRTSGAPVPRSLIAYDSGPARGPDEHFAAVRAGAVSICCWPVWSAAATMSLLRWSYFC
ncbi:hypothetical protein [Streptomyces spinoverrucosus]|uniref:hypothetical protein n=1 Tax=Streptomyces spinoverrucosus TaxID=284043 RepID=UPI001E4797A2